MKVKTYKEMNEKIVSILRHGESAEQYAAQYIEELQDENAKLKSKFHKLELTLFLVVRNSSVLPTGLSLGKTNKEITDMTLETIEKIKKSINYNSVEELIKENKND